MTIVPFHITPCVLFYLQYYPLGRLFLAFLTHISKFPCSNRTLRD
ncbi:hypothetical protein Hanom_Chr16g01477621 [Helianthus anomalus]